MFAADVSLLSPNMSTAFLNSASQFSCEAYCHESLVVAWLLNGSFLGHLGNSYVQCVTMVNNSCISTLELVPESLDPFTVQCAAVYVCDPGVTGCRPRVCYSPPMHVNIEGKSVHIIAVILCEYI